MSQPRKQVQTQVAAVQAPEDWTQIDAGTKALSLVGRMGREVCVCVPVCVGLVAQDKMIDSSGWWSHKSRGKLSKASSDGPGLSSLVTNGACACEPNRDEETRKVRRWR